MHSRECRYWYSMAASLNRAAQPEKAEVRLEIDQALVRYIDGLSDRGHFDAVQVAPGNSGEVPDEPGGVRLVVLGVAQPHNRRSDSYAMAEAKELQRQRGKTPRVYRNTLLFIAADARQLDSLGEAMRGSLAWRSILKDAGAGRLDLRESDKAFAQEQASSADQTLQIRLKEAWCYLICPEQESPQTEVEFFSTHVTAQDGVLSRASRKLAGDNVLLPEIGPQNLNVKLQKYIWQQKPHLLLQDLWKHLNSFVYLPRLKGRQVLINAVQQSIGGIVPGAFAYAETWDEENQCYLGLAIDNAGGTVVMLDDQALLVRADIAGKRPLSGRVVRDASRWSLKPRGKIPRPRSCRQQGPSCRDCRLVPNCARSSRTWQA